MRYTYSQLAIQDMFARKVLYVLPLDLRQQHIFACFPMQVEKIFWGVGCNQSIHQSYLAKGWFSKMCLWYFFVLNKRHFFGLKNPTLQSVGHKVYHRRILQPRNQVLDGSQDLLMQQQVGCVIWIEWYQIPGGRDGFLGFGGWWVWKGINYYLPGN